MTLKADPSIVKSYQRYVSLMCGTQPSGLANFPISNKSKQTSGGAVTILLFMRF